MNNKNDFYERRRYSINAFKGIENSLDGNNRLNVVFKEIVKVLNINKRLNILDIGCGNGAIIGFLQKKYGQHNYYGSDISKKAINLAKKQFLNINFSTADFNTKTGYKSNYFDIIIAGEIVEHLNNSDNLFAEARRILKKGGYLFITTPNLSSWIDRLMLLFGYLPLSMEVSNNGRSFGRKRFYREGNESISIGHIRCFTWSALVDLSRYYEFTIVSHKGAWFHPALINKLITLFLPSFSQQQVIVLKK